MRFSIADCKQHSAVCSSDANYTAIQRFILRQNAICREEFERAIAIAFTRFARQIRAIPIP